MTTMHYLHNNGRVVKEFVVRERNTDKLISACAQIKDMMSKFKGELLFEKKLSEVSHFMIVSFEDQILMTAWESLLSGAVTMEDIISSNVLIVKSDCQNNKEALDACTEAKNLLPEHKGAVLSEKQIANGEYRLVLFFTDKKQMLSWEKLLGVKGS